MIRFGLTFTLFSLIGITTKGQEQFIIKKDLHPEWLVYEQDKYIAYNQSQESVNTIYFSIKSNSFQGDYLSLTSTSQFSIMLNGKLILDKSKRSILSMDSLRKNYTSPFFLTLHQKQTITPTNLVTVIYSKVMAAPISEMEHKKRETS